MRRRLFTIGLGALLLATLGACGRRSLPKAPEGSTYPREYPTPASLGRRGLPESESAPAPGAETESEPLVPSPFPTYGR